MPIRLTVKGLTRLSKASFYCKPGSVIRYLTKPEPIIKNNSKENMPRRLLSIII